MKASRFFFPSVRAAASCSAVGCPKTGSLDPVFYPKHCFSTFWKHARSTSYIANCGFGPTDVLLDVFQGRFMTHVWQIRLMRITRIKQKVPNRRLAKVVDRPFWRCEPEVRGNDASLPQNHFYFPTKYLSLTVCQFFLKICHNLGVSFGIR